MVKPRPSKSGRDVYDFVSASTERRTGPDTGALYSELYPAQRVWKSIKKRLRSLWEAYRRRRLFGPLAPMVPAAADMYDGPGSLEDFYANGEEFLRIYTEVCALAREERMLDVGSGMGRKTIQLTRYLSERASYVGLDVNPSGVDWCRRTISSRYPNFTFQRIDVHNQLYNPSGTTAPSVYRFPFADGSFTFVVLASVFTHMLPDAVRQYLSEVARVLAPGGRCLITYFLLQDESRQLIAAGASTQAFVQSGPQYATVSPDIPEKAVAFDEDFVVSLYEEAGLRVTRLDRGSWCGRKTFLSYQDLVLATKALAA